MTDRRGFVAWLGALPALLRRPGDPRERPAPAPAPVITAIPTALYRQPDGRNNLVHVTVTGLDAPAARARARARRGAPRRPAAPPRPGGGGGRGGRVGVSRRPTGVANSARGRGE